MQGDSSNRIVEFVFGCSFHISSLLIVFLDNFAQIVFTTKLPRLVLWFVLDHSDRNGLRTIVFVRQWPKSRSSTSWYPELLVPVGNT